MPLPADWLERLARDLEALRKLERELLAIRARIEAARGKYRCTVCRVAYVDAQSGEDTCPDCARRI